jgi:uncharacterized membrane protein YeiH
MRAGASPARLKALVALLDISGTFVFAVEGALAAIRSNMELLGVLVLSFVTALGGGIVRDLIIGATPPSAFQDRRYPLTAFAAAVVSFVLFEHVQSIPIGLVQTLDAAGLALFAVAGAEKALDWRIDPLGAVLLGGITGVGGGTIRDVFLARIPLVLQADVYATAALLGAAIVVAGRAIRVPATGAALAGGIACLTLRLLSLHFHWALPKAPIS